MRLIFNRYGPTIDKNMSDCKIGGRKGMGCRNNIFMINGIIHDVLSSAKKSPVILQVYDYSQMFDGIKLEEALSDIFDVGVQDENLGLLYKDNKTVHMAVKTSSGLSDRKPISSSVLQGDTFGPPLASVQADHIGRATMEEGYFYKYKDVLPVGVLGLVDDLLGITKVGHIAHEMNSFINIKSAEKRLQFGATKCKILFVGKKEDYLTQNKFYVDQSNQNKANLKQSLARLSLVHNIILLT